jgi:hypothetical protein
MSHEEPEAVEAPQVVVAPVGGVTVAVHGLATHVATFSVVKEPSRWLQAAKHQFKFLFGVSKHPKQNKLTAIYHPINEVCKTKTELKSVQSVRNGK